MKNYNVIRAHKYIWRASCMKPLLYIWRLYHSTIWHLVPANLMKRKIVQYLMQPPVYILPNILNPLFANIFWHLNTLKNQVLKRVLKTILLCQSLLSSPTFNKCRFCNLSESNDIPLIWGRGLTSYMVTSFIVNGSIMTGKS